MSIWSGIGITQKKMLHHILLINPEMAQLRLLKRTLSQTDYVVKTASSADAALRLALTDLPLLVVADITFEEPVSLYRLRREHRIPLVLISSRGNPDDELIGLRMGADDVITRPDNQALLLARIEALLRRTDPPVKLEEDAAPIVLGDMRIDPNSHTVTVAQQPVELSAREFRLLYALASDAGAVVSRDELLDRVWGPDFEGEMQTVYVYISWLRKKLEAMEAPRIVTVHGIGYKLMETEKD